MRIRALAFTSLSNFVWWTSDTGWADPYRSFPTSNIGGHERMKSCPVQAPCLYPHRPLQPCMVTDNPLFSKSSRLSQFSFSWLSSKYLELFASCTILKLYLFLAFITSHPLNILLSNNCFLLSLKQSSPLGLHPSEQHEVVERMQVWEPGWICLILGCIIY